VFLCTKYAQHHNVRLISAPAGRFVADASLSHR